MKIPSLITCLAILVSANSLLSMGQSAPPPSGDAPPEKFDLEKTKSRMLKQYDRNQNGKIDADEHRDFSRAIAVEQKIAQRKTLEAKLKDPSLRHRPKPGMDAANEFL